MQGGLAALRRLGEKLRRSSSQPLRQGGQLSSLSGGSIILSNAALRSSEYYGTNSLFPHPICFSGKIGEATTILTPGGPMPGMSEPDG